MNLSELLTELDEQEYQEFVLNALHSDWQEREVYGGEYVSE